MKPDLAPWEKAVVRILIDGETAGTGFVISNRHILTCAHVVAHDDQHPKGSLLEIEFFSGPKQNPQSRRVVTLAKSPFSPSSLEDIAILAFDHGLPDGVKPLEFAFISEPRNTPVCSRGYPEIHRGEQQDRHQGLTGAGLLFGTTENVNTTSLRWLIDSNQITDGFSGAPLVRTSDRQVVGMAVAVISPDGNFRNTTTAIAISSSTIAEVCHELFKAPIDDPLKQHENAILNLKKQVTSILNDCVDAQSRLAEILNVRGVANDKQINSICKELFDHAMTVDRLVKILVGLHLEFKKSSNDKAAQAIHDVYAAVAAAILDPELLKELQAKRILGDRLLVIPCSQRTIVALVMSGLNGKLGKLRTTEKGLPASSREVPHPTECGISMKADEEVERYIGTVADTLKIVESDLNGDREERLDFINIIIKSFEEDTQESYFLVVHDHGKASPSDEEIMSRIRDLFPELNLIHMDTPSCEARHSQIRALSFWQTIKLAEL